MLAPATLVAMVAVVGASPAIASASLTPHQLLWHGAHGAPGSGLPLAQAPAGLRSAVRRTLGAPATSAISASQQAKLTASDGAKHDNFGWSVAISGPTAVVGADTKNSGTGAAYVFTRSGTTWTQQAKLTASDAAAGDNFGFSVAVAGATALVGANDKSSNTGAAYVFTRSGTTWTQQAKLTASDAAANGFFGWSVALSGGAMAEVGATGSNHTGAAYVFTRTGTIWTQQARLAASGGIAGDNFGYSVALSGNTAAVGAINNNAGAGAAYIFSRIGTTWSQQAKLTASDGAASDFFGTSLGITADTAVVGAPDNLGTGAAYVFKLTGSTWTQDAKLTASGTASNGFFGFSVSLSGTTAVVGSYGRKTFTGAAFVFANV